MMNALRSQYLEALRKVPVSKSADSVAPVCGLRIGGKLLGFGTLERVSRQEVQKMVALDSKADPNSVFDSAAILPASRPAVQDVEDVQKSVSNPRDENDCLSALFPFHRAEVQKSANPDAAEMMNRLTGQQSSGGPKNPPGRPASSNSDSPLQNFDVDNPQTTYALKGENVLAAGSVLKVQMPDGSFEFLVVVEDVIIDTLGELE